MDATARTKIDYLRAVRVLNSMQDTSFYGSWTDSKTKCIDMALSCLGRIGMDEDAINRLQIIHVAGTKGKGSTCAYVDSILRQYKDDVTSKPRFKTGIFSSPHLIEARERIRIDGLPVSMVVFTDTFWHIFDKLQATKAKHEKRMPGYFGVTLLMALRIFLQLRVDVVIMEVGLGGQYDSTNVISRPVACAIASLHLEHVQVLGNTVEEIAWHKAGIMKAGVPMITARHQESVMNVIRNRAREKGKRCPLLIVPELSPQALSDLAGPLGIAGDRQPINAALAVQLCRTFLQRQGRRAGLSVRSEESYEEHTVEFHGFSQEEKQGLPNARLPGRNQVVKGVGLTYYLDGAHTTASMQQCVGWFQTEADKEREALGKEVKRCFVFRMDKNKSATNHFPYLKDCGFRLERAAFCPHVISTTNRNDYPDSMDIFNDPGEAKKIAEDQMQAWVRLQTGIEARCFPSIVSALWWAGMCKDRALEDLALKDLQGDGQGDLCAAAAETVSHAHDRAVDNLALKDPRGGVQGHAYAAAETVPHVQVLVTGSLVMVGGALTLLKPGLWD